MIKQLISALVTWIKILFWEISCQNGVLDSRFIFIIHHLTIVEKILSNMENLVPDLSQQPPWQFSIRHLWGKLKFELIGVNINTGKLGYDEPLYDGPLHMTDHILCPSPMHIKYVSYVYDRFCI